jgi:hypothetical protein
VRTLSEGMLNALGGSVPDARLTAAAWYDGALREPELPVSTWSVNWDGADNTLVQGKASITVADPTGRLAPWGFDEPLSAAGSRLLLTFRCGVEAVDLGWFTVSDNQPTEQWRIVGPALHWVSGGASSQVQAEDMTLLVSVTGFMAPEAPPAGATVVSEIRRLLTGICPVSIAAGVTDAPVPGSIVYKDDRLAAVQDLARVVNARYRMTGDGSLEVYSLAQTAPVWTIQGGDGGALVSLNRRQARADLINGVVSTSNDPSLEIRALETIQAGPLRWDGPFGRKFARHNAIATDQDGVQADARTYLADTATLKTVSLTVLCKPHPGIQIGDWVRVAQPTINGAAYPLDGIVTNVQLKGSASGVEPMQITVQCALADVQAVGLSVRGAA